MIIVPGFAATAITNLVELLKLGYSDIGSLLRSLFILKTGDFFIILLIQSAATHILVQFSNIASLFSFYISPIFMMRKRMKEISADIWNKEHGKMFPFGMNYAVNLVDIGVAIIFQYVYSSYSSQIPYINLAIVFHLICRHISDGYQILIWHRIEMEASGILIDRCIHRLIFLLLISQISIIFKSAVTSYYYVSLFCTILFLVTLIIYVYILRKPSIRPDIYILADNETEAYNPNIILGWWNKYRHPLVSATEEHMKENNAQESSIVYNIVLYGRDRILMQTSVINAFKSVLIAKKKHSLSYIPKGSVNKYDVLSSSNDKDLVELQNNPFFQVDNPNLNTESLLARRLASAINRNSLEKKATFESYIDDSIIGPIPKHTEGTSNDNGGVDDKNDLYGDGLNSNITNPLLSSNLKRNK